MSYYSSYGKKRIPQKDQKELFRVEISDCIGNSLEPGMIIAYSAGAKLKFGVYEGVAKITRPWMAPGRCQYRVQLCTARKGKIRRSIIGYLDYDKTEQAYSIPENLVAVKNPLYHLGSSAVAECLQAIDKLKDEGHLPEDYKVK